MKERYMPYNHTPFRYHRICFVLAAFLVFSVGAYSQVNEPKATPVYDYLYRMAQKGLIQWEDYQLPLDRRSVLAALDSLSGNAGALSKVESEELGFYLREYSFDSDANKPEAQYLFRKDDAGRLRAGLFQKGDIRLFVDPVFGAAHFRSGGKSNTQYYSGLRLGAYFGKRWGVNFSFRDVTEKGDSIDR
ncbi:MAG TPA: hypothetical protein VFR58_08345, partial [Flavisolibacter sp.]|nr:hypothetical protein [Flavisolibacter sp.]